MNTTNQHIKEFFATGATLPIAWRIKQLKHLKKAIVNNQAAVLDALWKDLHKSNEEAFLTEVYIVLEEINLHIRKLKSWAKIRRVGTPIYLFPSKSYITHQPLGTALIISPWNYPFQLTIAPLIGAISAGCCAMLKPSPASQHTSNIIERIIREAFGSNYIDIAQGDRHVNTALLAQRWDIIFFTGSPAFGKVVHRAAAEHLTPVILELGGKSPCIIDRDANINTAAKRIAWGKLVNGGQTCVAPDYFFVHKAVKKAFINAVQKEIEVLYGKNAQESANYPRMISYDAYDRVSRLIEGEDIIYGGKCIREDKYISPTILDNITPQSAIMGEEIFGPLIPIMTFENIDRVVEYINGEEKPLALYYFGHNNAEHVLGKTSSGGACVNDLIIHVSNHHLPFGGVGNSGMGAYHGKRSFEAFSHKRAIMKTTTLFDIPLKNPPFKYFGIIKKFL